MNDRDKSFHPLPGSLLRARSAATVVFLVDEPNWELSAMRGSIGGDYVLLGDSFVLVIESPEKLSKNGHSAVRVLAAGEIGWCWTYLLRDP